jgi:hypothetical protein
MFAGKAGAYLSEASAFQVLHYSVSFTQKQMKNTKILRPSFGRL